MAKNIFTFFQIYMITPKISLSGYEKCYPSRLKRYFQSNINYSDYDKLVNNVKFDIIGNLPSDIIKLFKGDKKEHILEFQDTLSEVAYEIRKKYFMNRAAGRKFWDFNDVSRAETNDFETYISDYLTKKVAHLMPEGTKFYLQYVNRGVFKMVFRLSMVDGEFNRLMHDKAFQVCLKTSENRSGLADRHNIFAETNWWYFLAKNCGHKLDKTQFTRHYISDLSKGYMMTEFADKDVAKTTSYINLKNVYGVRCCDSRYNDPINGKLYDGGGYIKTEDFIEDKVVRRYFKKLYSRKSEKDLRNTMESINKLLANPKTPLRNKIQRALDLYQERFGYKFNS